MKDLGDRMKKNYEDRCRIKLTRRTPVILRLDGRAFHTLTRHFKKPFDAQFVETMASVAFVLCHDIQGAKVGYVQSDEISILLTDFDTFHTDAWFDYNVQKMVSIAAAMASVWFSRYMHDRFTKEWTNVNAIPMPVFDCRAFNIPREDVQNYFVWRQMDWTRNSLHMLARTHFSHKELLNKNAADIHEMLHGIDENWAHLNSVYKNGTTLLLDRSIDNNWDIVTDLQFSKSPSFIEDKYFTNLEE